MIRTSKVGAITSTYNSSRV